MMRPPGRRWTEYLIEGLLLAAFMVSACGFGALLEHPDSPLHRALPDGNLRRLLMGLAMGTTAVALIYSAPGRRSGAHINPATTLAFWSLGRVRTADAVGYGAAQILGGAAGTLVMGALFGAWLGHPAVHYVVTRPGAWGAAPAFVAEVAISGLLIAVILRVSASRHERFTGLAAGALVALYITFEAPVSGMSMNPARSLASALGARDFGALWIYFAAPPLGMALAALQYRAALGARARTVGCAKLRHDATLPCIFCGHDPAPHAVAAAALHREPGTALPH